MSGIHCHLSIFYKCSTSFCVLYTSIAVQHEALTDEDLGVLEAQRKNEERQEVEVTEEPKGFMLQETVRGFSGFEDTKDPNIGLHQLSRMQSSATRTSAIHDKQQFSAIYDK